jgi:hypothetical protein
MFPWGGNFSRTHVGVFGHAGHVCRKGELDGLAGHCVIAAFDISTTIGGRADLAAEGVLVWLQPLTDQPGGVHVCGEASHDLRVDGLGSLCNELFRVIRELNLETAARFGISWSDRDLAVGYDDVWFTRAARNPIPDPPPVINAWPPSSAAIRSLFLG